MTEGWKQTTKAFELRKDKLIANMPDWQRYDELDFSSESAKMNTSTYKASIAMPLPNNLDEVINQNWEKEKNILAYSLEKGIPAGDIVARVVNSVATQTGTRNVTTNPDYVQIYKGPEPREISFTWNLTPNNKEEADTIFRIIRKLKRFSAPHPSKTYAFLTSPFFCKITFSNTRIQDSMRFYEGMIQSVNTNYSQTGYMETFYDGSPKAMTLSVKILERRPKLYDDWRAKDMNPDTQGE